jgi:hypothetical protein
MVPLGARMGRSAVVGASLRFWPTGVHRDVTGYNVEALGVFSRTTTSVQLVATIRSFESGLGTG